MKKILISALFLTGFIMAKAQAVENIYVNLYTDSLKKGTHNYINVDGKLTNGNWKPLTDSELRFSSDYGSFEGNSLVLADNPSVKKVTITVTLKANPQKTQQVTIWIKQKPDPMLPVNDPDSNIIPKRRRG